MKTVYLNWKGPQGLETVDEFTREQGQTVRQFRQYVRQMITEYEASGMAVYWSSRCCKGWREKA